MKSHEEELQDNVLKKLESVTPSDPDEKSYRYVFHALSREPEHTLPEDFTDRVVNLAYAKRKTILSNDWAWLLIICVCTITALVSTVLLTDFRINFRFLNTFSLYWSPIGFGAALILIIQILDRAIIRPKYR